MSEIYNRIEQIRLKSGLSKKDFVKKAGVSAGNLGDWKSGKSMPGANALMRMATEFHVSLDWLMMGKESPAMIKEAGAAYFLRKNGN